MDAATKAVDKARGKRDVVDDQWGRYVRARDSGHKDYIGRAKQCDQFYLGQQWDPADEARLNAEGRPTLTINTILPTINAVLGEQAARRASVRFRAKRNGNPHTANALTKLVMQILENNDFQYIESEVFADGLIEERGYFDIRMNFDSHALGDAAIECRDPKDVIPDPDASSYDPEKWNEVFITRWMSIDEIGHKYGEAKAKDVLGRVYAGTHFGQDSVRFENESYFGDTRSQYVDEELLASSKEQRAIRSVRVIERQYYRYEPTWYFVNLMTGDLRRVPETWTDEQREGFADKNGIGVTSKAARRVRWTVTADSVLLHDGWSPYKTFTIVPYFCYFRRGKPLGMVTNLISPQEQLNKVSSQELHIVNTTANSGWIMETGSLVNMTADELAERGAQTGLVLEVEMGRNSPEKIQPNQIPTGLDRVAYKSEGHIRAISGVNEGMLGMSGAEVSGVALDNKERRGQVQLQKPLDNLARTRRMVAQKLLELIQQFYTEERIITITNEWTPGEPTEEMVINQQTATGEILNDLTFGEYSAVITSIPNHQTFDDLMFESMLRMREAGIMVPDHHVLKHSPLPNRDEIAVEVAELQGFGEPTPEEQELMAIQQELELRGQEAAVQKLEGEVQELQSKVELNLAKAGQLSEEGQLEMAKAVMELEKKRSEMALRKQLAQLSSATQIRKQQMNNDTRLIGDAMQRMEKRVAPQPKKQGENA